MERTYLDKTGLNHVIEKVNKKLTVNDTVPTASALLLGKQYLYVGPKTSELLKGGIYECQEVPETSPVEYKWVLISVANVDLSKYLPSWEGTEQDWEALTDDEKAEYVVVHITNDDESEYLTIHELDSTSEKPVSAKTLSDIISTLTRTSMWVAIEYGDTKCKAAPLEIPNTTARYIVYKIDSPKVNSHASASFILVTDGITGAQLAIKNIPSSMIIDESGELITIALFIKNTNNADIHIHYYVTGDSDNYGVADDRLFYGCLYYAESVWESSEAMYEAMDGEIMQGTGVLYLEVT